jgi:predicted nicotinamide N-methyase
MTSLAENRRHCDENQEQHHNIFSITSSLNIKLQHATNNDDNQGEHETNTGFIMWPSAVLLSHHLVQNPELWRRMSKVEETDNGNVESNDNAVLELGAGCGLSGLTVAALMKQESMDDKVVFTDYNPAVLKNLKQNIELNNFHVDHEVKGLDWFDQQPPSEDDDDSLAGTQETKKEVHRNTWLDMEGKKQNQFKLVIGADLLVCSNDAELVAHAISATLADGGKAVIVGPSASARFGVNEFPGVCRSLGMNVEIDEDVLESILHAGIEDGKDSNDLQQLMTALKQGGHGQRSSAAYGHDFTIFTIDKPVAT